MERSRWSGDICSYCSSTPSVRGVLEANKAVARRGLTSRRRSTPDSLAADASRCKWRSKEMKLLFASNTSGLTTAESALLVAFLAGVTGAVAAAFLGRWSDATSRRRATYASAVQNLYSWAEFPFRIRRRTSDSPDELSKLADLGHELQERLRWSEAWITTESRWLAIIFSRTLRQLSHAVGPAASEAWRSPPALCAADMVLDGWGPADYGDCIDRFQRATSWRFGIRRLISRLSVHP